MISLTDRDDADQIMTACAGRRFPNIATIGRRFEGAPCRGRGGAESKRECSPTISAFVTVSGIEQAWGGNVSPFGVLMSCSFRVLLQDMTAVLGRPSGRLRVIRGRYKRIGKDGTRHQGRCVYYDYGFYVLRAIFQKN